MKNFVFIIYFIFMFSTIAKSETYLCERQISSGIDFSEIKRKWKATPFSIDKDFKNFSISDVTETDYRDGTFEMFNMKSSIPAKILKPKYKIISLYKNNSKAFKICQNDFNTNGYLFCDEGNLILNRKNLIS